jgi:hypothetical protein
MDEKQKAMEAKIRGNAAAQERLEKSRVRILMRDTIVEHTIGGHAVKQERLEKSRVRILNHYYY